MASILPPRESEPGIADARRRAPHCGDDGFAERNRVGDHLLRRLFRHGARQLSAPAFPSKDDLRCERLALPVDPVAREIIRQGALRRGEKDPTL
jgi:hypothetical protein